MLSGIGKLSVKWDFMRSQIDDSGLSGVAKIEVLSGMGENLKC